MSWREPERTAQTASGVVPWIPYLRPSCFLFVRVLKQPVRSQGPSLSSSAIRSKLRPLSSVKHSSLKTPVTQHCKSINDPSIHPSIQSSLHRSFHPPNHASIHPCNCCALELILHLYSLFVASPCQVTTTLRLASSLTLRYSETGERLLTRVTTHTTAYATTPTLEAR